MKKIPLLLLAGLAFTPLRADPPTIPIEQAMQLAQGYLKDHGLDGQHYLVSLGLEQSSLANKETYWFAKWEHSFKSDGGTNEVGLRINMDGSIARLTSGGPGGSGGRPDQPGVRPVGARNIR